MGAAAIPAASSVISMSGSVLGGINKKKSLYMQAAELEKQLVKVKTATYKKMGMVEERAKQTVGMQHVATASQGKTVGTGSSYHQTESIISKMSDEINDLSTYYAETAYSTKWDAEGLRTQGVVAKTIGIGEAMNTAFNTYNKIRENDLKEKKKKELSERAVGTTGKLKADNYSFGDFNLGGKK